MQKEKDIKNYAHIPIHQELISLVKTIDGLSDSEILKLKLVIYKIAGISKDQDLQDGLIDAKQVEYMQRILKIHQIFALVNVEYKLINTSPKKHLKDILDQFVEKGGLDYLPRERTPQGRLFDHASDSRVLVNHLRALDASKEEDEMSLKKPLFYIKLVEDNPQSQQNGDSTTKASTEEKDNENKDSDFEDYEEAEEQEHEEEESSLTYLMQLQQSFLDFILNANGKADIYFHSYLWMLYLKTVYFQEKTSSTDQDFEQEVVQKNKEVQRMQGLAESLKKVAANITKFTFREKQYEKYVNSFGGRKSLKKVKLLEELHKSLFIAQLSDDKESLNWIEKLLIQLLGYHDISVRDQAVVFLNMLYDEVDWQITQAFRPVVRCIGQHFKVHVIINYEMTLNKKSQIFLGLSAPSPIENQNQKVLTWHKIDHRNIVKQQGIETEIHINFGKFWKCGFYDWRLVTIKEDGKLQPLEIIGKPEPVFPKSRDFDQEYIEDDDSIGNIAQGRFIAQAKGMKDHIFHEVQVDFQDAEFDTKNNTFTKRGNFNTVEKNIDDYKKKGITALYMMGVLERDNYPFLNKMSNEIEFRKAEASPLAITCRKTANKMLGGDEGFKKVMTKAKQNKIKIVIDCLARISSSRNHRKYRDLLLNYLDEEGRRNICYGTDGQAINYEDTAMLNYRKVEAWDLLIDEVIGFAKDYQIDGIHLDNGQAWPQIMETDLEELKRLDVDGVPAYSPLDLMNGEIVLKNENFGYWNTNTMEQYPNPFFIKLCKRIWEQLPNFMVIGECWGGFMFENRQIILSRSGIIPRMFKLPQVISSIFGKKLYKDGRVTQDQPQDVIAFKKWYESSRQFLPEGAILIQSSSTHVWPYPAYLYEKGTWAAVDILYFMPDIPITFMGEINGEVYRIGQTQIYQHEQQQIKSSGLKKTNSQLMLALQTNDEEEEENKSAKSQNSEQQSQDKRGMTKVRSGSNLAAIVVQQQQVKDIKQEEAKFQATIGPQFGYNLKTIHTHYENRRRLRREKMVLRYGDLVQLIARHDKGWNQKVLAFGRYSLIETAIIAINLNDQEETFYIDLSNLQKIYGQKYPESTVIMATKWLDQTEKPEYYFLKEFLKMKQYQTLQPYHSFIVSISICQDDEFVLKKTLTQSIERTKKKLQNGESIESEQISILVSDIIENTPYDIEKFANVVGSIQEIFLDKLGMTLNDLFINNHKLRNDPLLASRMLALCQRIIEIADKKNISPKLAAQTVVNTNKLGPIVFCTPELGRWSTVGGLGVMVDELSQGLALLGQEVWVISPYYERNRKGETGYLARDPAGIEYKDNITVNIAGGTTMGVHEGSVGGVNLAFLHHTDIFPSPYPDFNAADVVKQMAVFGKGCLEFCCKRQIIPSLCVSNDWFTSLVPGYAKVKAFGDTFNGTTFFHIVHNLEPSYEGRLYPDPHQGTLEGLHQLPKEWLIDPHWQKLVINPSRCGLLVCDQWGTVSPSYKEDLLRESPLQGILRMKPHAFAFPNGIPVKSRMKRLDEAAPDHLTAKKMLQKKYFNFQDLDDSVPLVSFVGRITAQKGVHLILDAAEHIINDQQGKINILVGGAANMRDPYSSGCAHKMWHLRNKYPNNFWAAPNEFFTDGSLLNRGSDFGLMPSKFEPGGIVQHEFFVGGTPVIAFKTGGLKDSVIEYMWDTEEGNGYTFESHTPGDFIFACKRALGTFKNKAKYQKLRENAYNSTMDLVHVSKAWLGEFCRLRGKVFVDEYIIKDTLKNAKPWDPTLYKPMKNLEELLGINQKLDIVLEDIDLGAEEEKEVFDDEKKGYKKVLSHFEHPPEDEKFPHVFMMHNHGQRYSQVQLCGSFDNWKTRHTMSFDDLSRQWFINLHLKKGKYYYKYIINGDDWRINEKESTENDNAGNKNNVLVL